MLKGRCFLGWFQGGIPKQICTLMFNFQKIKIMKTKKIIFWVVVAILVIGLGLYLKYASFGATVITIIVGACGVAAGWLAKFLYDRYVKE